MTTLPLLLLLLLQDGSWSAPVEIAPDAARVCADIVERPDGSLILASMGGTKSIELRSSKDGANWSEGRPLAKARFGRFLRTDKEPIFFGVGQADLLVVRGEKSSAVPPEGLEPKVQLEYTSAMMEGAKIYVAQTTEHPVHMLFTSSEDGGATWAPWTFIGKELWQNDSLPAAIWLEKKAIHVLYTTQENKGSKPVHVTSEDGGKTWKEKGFKLDLDAAMTACWRATIVEGVVWLSFLAGGEGGVAYYVAKSTDGGATWSKPAKVDDTRGGDLVFFFDLKVAGGAAVFTFSKMGKSDLHAAEARVLRSTDAGATWKDLKLGEDAGEFDTGFPVAAPRQDGSIVVAYVKGPKEAQAAGRAPGTLCARTWKPKQGMKK